MIPSRLRYFLSYVLINANLQTEASYRKWLDLFDLAGGEDNIDYGQAIFDDLDIHKNKRKPMSRFNGQKQIQETAMADLKFDTYYEGVHTLHPYHGKIVTTPLHSF